MLKAGIAAIMLDSGTLQQLDSLVHPTEELKQAGYVVTKLTQNELEQKKRCATCGVRSESLAILVPPVQCCGPAES